MAVLQEYYKNSNTGDLFIKMWITSIKNSEQYFKNGFDCNKKDLIGCVPLSKRKYEKLIDKKREEERILLQKIIDRDTTDMIIGIDKFGKVIQCQKLDGKFHVKITDGFDIKMTNTFGLMKIILDAVGKEFPIIDKQTTDYDLFHLILKPDGIAPKK